MNVNRLVNKLSPSWRRITRAPRNIAMSNQPEFDAILTTNSTDRFYIEYEGYLFNHLSHGIVALAHLGANAERLNRFVKWYVPRLEEPKFTNNAETSDLESLLGARTSFYSLLSTYKKQLRADCDGSLEKLIQDTFPKLFPGLLGSALHGLIHLGYGYSAKNPQLVCEGLAYMHYCYMPMVTEATPQLDKVGKGQCSILEVLERIRGDTELIEFMKAKSKSDEYQKLEFGAFSRKVKSLLSHRGDDLLGYAYLVQIPGMNKIEVLDFKDRFEALFRWLVNSAITVYTTTDKNDFFLLHGVTAAWSLLQVGAIGLARHQELNLQLFTTYLCALFAVYIAQGVPPLNLEKLNEDNTEQKAAWPSLVESTLTDDRDEHVYKLIQVCYELNQETEDQSLKNLYIKAATRALKEEQFTFE